MSGPRSVGSRSAALVPGARPPWLIERDLQAVAAHLDWWILAAEPDHDTYATAIPLLGTPEWVAAGRVVRDASVALYVLACLAEREPVVIAARLAAERIARLIALRQASHAVSAALTEPINPVRPTGQGGVWECQPHLAPL